MAVSKGRESYVRRIKDEFQNKRGAAQALCDARKAEIYSLLPQVQKIDAELAGTGLRILEAAMSGKNVEKSIGVFRESVDTLRKKRAELLIGAGYPADWTDIKYECEKCGDTGFVGIDMCGCMKKAISAARLEDSGLAALADVQTFDSFSLDYYRLGPERDNMAMVLKGLRYFAENFDAKTSANWLLMGGTGLGKTHLSTAAAVTVINRGYDVVYATAHAMLDDFEAHQFRGGEPDNVRRYSECDFLLIDDLGSELINQFTVSCVYNIINDRINAGESTLISTNLDQNSLREKYSDRICSRLFGEYRPVVFSGVDVRRQKIEKR